MGEPRESPYFQREECVDTKDPQHPAIVGFANGLPRLTSGVFAAWAGLAVGEDGEPPAQSASQRKRSLGIPRAKSRPYSRLYIPKTGCEKEQLGIPKRERYGKVGLILRRSCRNWSMSDKAFWGCFKYDSFSWVPLHAILCAPKWFP